MNANEPSDGADPIIRNSEPKTQFTLFTRRTGAALLKNLKAIRELGVSHVGLFIFYQMGLRTGFLRWRTQSALQRALSMPTGDLAQTILPPPDLHWLRDLLRPDSIKALQQDCKEIASGTTRIFGDQKASIIPQTAASLSHWSALRESALDEDVKWIWEPARFGWVFPLTQAALLIQDEQYAAAFMPLSERFFQANPPYYGWQWYSAQEVAIRLISLAYAGQRFGIIRPLSIPQRQALARWIAIHASRIPATLAYGRAQNNNHLLSEAAGLFTAGLVIPCHPCAADWQSLGWKWLEKGLLDQIATSGEYIQHSANYHRLMLQLVIWCTLIGESNGYRWSESVLQRIRAAILWLAALTDPESGCVPNLGPNDGAFLLPLTQCNFADYRPVLQAAARLFFKKPLFPKGPWDDYSAWLGISPGLDEPSPEAIQSSPSPLTLRHPRMNSWCYLRATRFTARPGHADQLHLDVWWNGMNIALDPGTYLYNAPPPWDNSLTHTAVHNTLTLENLEQMTRAGRFLYLDWAQADVLAKSPDSIAAWHNGYRKLGLRHERRVRAVEWGWIVEDHVLPTKSDSQTLARNACLHWLLPDWNWSIEQDQAGCCLMLQASPGSIRLSVYSPSCSPENPTPLQAFLVRGGETIFGSEQAQPTWGWISPTYGVKLPALAFGVRATCRPPFSLVTEWRLPGG